MLIQIKGKEVDLILDLWTKCAYHYYTHLCIKHAHLIKSEKKLKKVSIQSLICGVQGCIKEADYYYEFDEKVIRNG